MTPKQKADELYINAFKRAKEQSLKSATSTHALAPYSSRTLQSRSYWEEVINFLNEKNEYKSEY